MADIVLGSLKQIIKIAGLINEAVKKVKQNKEDCLDIQICVDRLTRIIDCNRDIVKPFLEESPERPEANYKNIIKVLCDTTEDLAKSLEATLALVIKCQQTVGARRLLGSKAMAENLRRAQNDILGKQQVFNSALAAFNTACVTRIVLLAPPSQQGVGTEKPSNGGPLINGDASGNYGRYDTDEIDELTTGSGALSDPSAEFDLHELEISTHDFQGVATEDSSHDGHLNVGDARYETQQINKLATGTAALSDPLSGFRNFNLYELEVATDNFSEEKQIGKGGSARVFQGSLRNEVVAIKVFNTNDVDELIMTTILLKNEMKNGVKLQHKNVVKTLGYCIEDKVVSSSHDGQEVLSIQFHRILVIGYLTNGSLGDMVQSGTQIHWLDYFDIIKGIAQGLHYLHEQNMVHGDLNPANILFDSEYNPVITDFGLSRVLDNEDYITTKEIKGTPGYMPPEYVGKGRVSKKQDVFAFGFVLMMTIFRTLFKAEYRGMEYHCMEVGWEPLLLGGVDQMTVFLDPTLVEESNLMDAARCLKITLLCIRFDPDNRPTMADVLRMLNGEKELPEPERTNAPHTQALEMV